MFDVAIFDSGITCGKARLKTNKHQCLEVVLLNNISNLNNIKQTKIVLRGGPFEIQVENTYPTIILNISKRFK